MMMVPLLRDCPTYPAPTPQDSAQPAPQAARCRTGELSPAQLPSTKTREQQPGPQLLSVVGGLFLARQHVQLTKTREQQPGPKLL